MRAGIKEKDFQQSVVDLAKLCGFLAYHTYDSRRSEPGFPDLVLAHPDTGRLIVAELKVGKNKLSEAQDRWLKALSATGCDVRLWRPEDWDEIQKLLTNEV